MNTKQRKARSQTTWYVINIKARRNQTPAHYVDAFRKIQTEDPLVQVYGKKYISIRSLHESETMEVDGVPQWMKACLAHYTIVDSDAFYNIRESVRTFSWHGMKILWPTRMRLNCISFLLCTNWQ